MRRRIHVQFTLVGFCAVLTACASAGGRPPIDLSKLPPIEVVIAPEPARPAPATPPVETPTLPPAPVPSEPERPLVNLNIVVHDAAGAGIPIAACAISGPTETGQPESRRAHAAGDINFAVRGSVIASCSAPGYITRSADLPPGDHRFPLVSIAPPAPPAPPKPAEPPPAPVTASSACGAATNSGQVSQACVDAVAATSSHAPTCRTTGDVEPCHLFVREVAIALRTAQKDPRWGLIKKTRGGDNFEGYGVDVVAYLPAPFPLTAQTHKWNGVDIIGCLGCKVVDGRESTLNSGRLHPVIECSEPPSPEQVAANWCNRRDDLWAPVPRAGGGQLARFARTLQLPTVLHAHLAAARIQSSPVGRSTFPKWKTRLGLVFSMACHGADVSISQFMFGRYPDRFTEGNPVLAWIDDPVAFGASKVGAAAGINWGLIELADHHPRAAFWGTVASGAGACYLAHHNAKLAGLR